MGQQWHFYGVNHLHYLTTSTYRRACLFDRRLVSSPDQRPWSSFRF
jgi:hypothetical protein